MDALGILDGLNSDQRAAVLHDHKKNAQLLILAGAGSGKTSVLTKRIQYRIASGVLPEKILALTFTAKAAAEMRERVQKLFPNAGVRLCTFHSLALFILKQKIGEKFAYELVGFRKAPVPQESVGREFLAEVSRLKIPSNKLKREDLFSDSHSSSVLLKIKGIRERVLESGMVVFEDLIYQAIRLLENNESARDYFRKMWTEIMVDEYQDINPSQYRLVKALLGNRRELFVVGDDDQAIYGFRGADIGNINRFCDDFKESTIIRLEWNYRSVPSILHLANSIFVNKPLRLRKVLRAGNMNGSGGNPLYRENREPEVWYSDNPVEEMLRIVGKIKELRLSYDLEFKNFAILVRYNRQRLYYENALREAGMPVFEQESEEDVPVNGIHVETVHASKGLQYAVVFYAGLAEGLTPGECTGSRKQQKNQLEEERRLFYVGVTRAESFLVLLYCKQRFWKGRLVNFKCSRFLPRKESFVWNMKMPLFLFRIYVLMMVAVYMVVHAVQILFISTFRRKILQTWIDKKVQEFSAYCMKLLRVDLTIENQAMLSKVDWTRPVFVMGNHRSYADIPVIFLTLQRTIGFIAKAQLGKIPLLNFWMRQIGCLCINREKGGGAALIRDALKTGRMPRLFIFPEGTRSTRDGMVAFKSGGFRLAIEVNAVILPVVMRGTANLWERRKDSNRKKVSVTILEPIDLNPMIEKYGDFDPRKELMPMVRSRMEEAL